MKQQLQYVLIPHPDDEFSAWSLIQDEYAGWVSIGFFHTSVPAGVNNRSRSFQSLGHTSWRPSRTSTVK